MDCHSACVPLNKSPAILSFCGSEKMGTSPSQELLVTNDTTVVLPATKISQDEKEEETGWEGPILRRLIGAAKKKKTPDAAGATPKKQLPEKVSFEDQVDYVQLSALMKQLVTQKEEKRAKATHYMLEARKLARLAKATGMENKKAIGINMGRANTLNSQAEDLEVKCILLDSQLEMLKDLQLNVQTLRTFAHSTRLLEQGLRQYSPQQVEKVMEEMEETTEKANELIRETSREPADQQPMGWKEYEKLMASVTEEDKEKKGGEDEKFQAAMSTLPNTPAMKINNNSRKGITVDEFESVSLFGDL